MATPVFSTAGSKGLLNGANLEPPRLAPVGPHRNALGFLEPSRVGHSNFRVRRQPATIMANSRRYGGLAMTTASGTKWNVALGGPEDRLPKGRMCFGLCLGGSKEGGWEYTDPGAQEGNPGLVPMGVTDAA